MESWKQHTPRALVRVKTLTYHPFRGHALIAYMFLVLLPWDRAILTGGSGGDGLPSRHTAGDKSPGCVLGYIAGDESPAYLFWTYVPDCRCRDVPCWIDLPS